MSVDFSQRAGAAATSRCARLTDSSIPVFRITLRFVRQLLIALGNNA
jgi:hypothetical protein